MRIQVSYFTHKGDLREKNEDSLLVYPLLFSETSFSSPQYMEVDSSFFLCALADGMGGHARGEVASKKVLEVLLQQAPSLKNSKEILFTLIEAKKELDEIAIKNPMLFGLGTTVAGLSLYHKKGYIFYSGDTRIYHFTPQEGLKRLTQEHSEVELLFQKGEITEEEMRNHPLKHYLTHAIIGDRREESFRVEIEDFTFEEESRLLILTDGVWEVCSKKEIEKILSFPTLKEATQELFMLLQEKFLRDNVSFILLYPP